MAGTSPSRSSKASAAGRSTRARWRSCRTGCALLLVGIILFVTYYDVGDMLPKSKSKVIPQIERRETVIESPKGPAATPAAVP